MQAPTSKIRRLEWALSLHHDMGNHRLMISEHVLLDYIQKPFDLGHKTRETLHTKFLDVKEAVALFIEESGSSIEACQRLGEYVGRFLGWGIGLCFAYVIIPGLALGTLMTMRTFRRGQVRWHNIRSWVTEPIVESSHPVSESQDVGQQNPFETAALDSATLDEHTSNAGEMVALPPCDQPEVDESPLSRSVNFVQQTASELPQTLTPEGIKTAYTKAKRKTQHNPILTGLVTAGFTAISFLAIQIDPAKEAFASHRPQSSTEEVTVLESKDYQDLELDPNDMN